METEAIATVLGHFDSKEWKWIGSEVIHVEINRMTDLERRIKVEKLASGMSQMVFLTEEHQKRAEELVTLGFKLTDALHVACAESEGACFLDNRRSACENSSQIQGNVKGPCCQSFALDRRSVWNMKTQTMTQEEVRSRGITVFRRELGAVGMLRFLRQFDRGKGDYTKERHRWLDRLTIDDIFNDVRVLRRNRS